jgi:hypothetical protein
MLEDPAITESVIGIGDPKPTSQFVFTTPKSVSLRKPCADLVAVQSRNAPAPLSWGLMLDYTLQKQRMSLFQSMF